MVDREEYSYCGQLCRSAGTVETAFGLMTCIPERIYTAHSQHHHAPAFVSNVQLRELKRAACSLIKSSETFSVPLFRHFLSCFGAQHSGEQLGRRRCPYTALSGRDATQRVASHCLPVTAAASGSQSLNSPSVTSAPHLTTRRQLGTRRASPRICELHSSKCRVEASSELTRLCRNTTRSHQHDTRD